MGIASSFYNIGIQILNEQSECLKKIDLKSLETVLKFISKAHNIFLYGVGREGLMMKAFGIRLFRLGLKTHISPEDQWQAFLEAISSVVKKSNLNPKKIIAMVIGTTCCSTLYIDKKFKPIRPSLIWMDVRSGKEAQNISKLNDNHLKVNGDRKTKVSTEWMIPKTLWVKKHESENYKKLYFCYKNLQQ